MSEEKQTTDNNGEYLFFLDGYPGTYQFYVTFPGDDYDVGSTSPTITVNVLAV